MRMAVVPTHSTVLYCPLPRIPPASENVRRSSSSQAAPFPRHAVSGWLSMPERSLSGDNGQSECPEESVTCASRSSDNHTTTGGAAVGCYRGHGGADVHDPADQPGASARPIDPREPVEHPPDPGEGSSGRLPAPPLPPVDRRHVHPELRGKFPAGQTEPPGPAAASLRAGR